MIAGKPEFRNFNHLLHIAVCLVSGGARGADALAKRYAQERGLKLIEVLANWTKLGRKAGHMRNETMAHLCDEVLAFWDGQSPGTKQMIGFCKSLGKPVEICQTQTNMH